MLYSWNEVALERACQGVCWLLEAFADLKDPNPVRKEAAHDLTAPILKATHFSAENNGLEIGRMLAGLLDSLGRSSSHLGNPKWPFWLIYRLKEVVTRLVLSGTCAGSPHLITSYVVFMARYFDRVIDPMDAHCQV